MLRIVSFILISLFLFAACESEDVHQFNQWELTDDEFDELLLLSDSSTISDYIEFSERLDRIQQIFAIHNDPRGTFTTLYEEITYAAINSIDEGIYDDGKFVGDFGLEFGKRYLINLHYHLLDQDISYTWYLFYQQCIEFDNMSRLLLSGMNSHITKDLFDALIAVEVTPEQEEDWVLISDQLIQGLSAFEVQFTQDYETDIEDLLALFGVSEFLDPIFGEEGSTLYTIFNGLRYVGYEDALRYQNGLENEMEFKTRKRFQDNENVIQLGDDFGLLP